MPWPVGSGPICSAVVWSIPSKMNRSRVGCGSVPITPSAP